MSAPLPGQRASSTSTPRRGADVRFALRLVYVTLAWMTIEAASSVVLGILARSLLLVAFGFDSVVELFSAAVLWWRLRTEAVGRADASHVERVERRASRLAGYALFALAAYIVATSVWGLLAHRSADVHVSVWGITIGVIAAVGMPVLARLKLKVAAPDRLNSAALRADAMEAVTCGYLSWILIAGLAATRLFGWWWMDSAAALCLIPFLLKEGWEAVTGKCGCHGGDCHG